jgi:ribosomal protein L7/L12
MMPTETQKSERLPDAAVVALERGNKIEAIKIVREVQRIDLKGAKDAVDKYVRSQPAPQQKFKAANENAKLCLFKLTVILGLAAAAAYYWLVASK